MTDPLHNSPASLLVKLGSIAVHADEFFSPSGHIFDGDAMKALLDDAEVKTWLLEMQKMGLVPVKR